MTSLMKILSNEMFPTISNDLYFPLHTNVHKPPFDVLDTDDAYVITADLPGVKRDEVEVYLQDGYLTIKGERRLERTGASRRERFTGKFYRGFQLPETASEKIEATMADGVLSIRVAKAPKALPRKIPIQLE